MAIGINAFGFREVLGIAVGDSEAEAFWHQFLGSIIAEGCDDLLRRRSLLEEKQ